MARKIHNATTHHDRCAKPLDDSHKICPLKPDPNLDVPEVEIEPVGRLGHHVTWITAEGSREYMTPDEAFEFASALLRAADRARKADVK